MRAKRRAVSIILFAAAKGVEVSLDKMKSAFDDGYRGGLKPSDRALIKRQYQRGRDLVNNVRRIAQHLWDTSRAKK